MISSLTPHEQKWLVEVLEIASVKIQESIRMMTMSAFTDAFHAPTLVNTVNALKEQKNMTESLAQRFKEASTIELH